MSQNRERFVPLSIREGKREPFKPTTGMPGYLWYSVKPWIEDYLTQFGRIQTPKLRNIVRVLRLDASLYQDDRSLYDSLFRELEFSSEKVLDVIDALLFLGYGVDEMDRFLWDVDHEYTVHTDKQRLVKKIDDTVWASYEMAVSPGDHAAHLLESAWAKQFSRDRDPAGAWDDATAAVEALLRPIVSPRDEAATIGKMIQAIQDAPHAWYCRIPDRDWHGVPVGGVAFFVNALCNLMYRPDRHGTANRSSEVTVEQSGMVVLQAVTVVGWLRQDGFGRIQ
ncbi:MAG: hypothetical protein E6474_09730 [Actinomyces sp.]|nr:hypothetical protein [Actinomyces sp.]